MNEVSYQDYIVGNCDRLAYFMATRFSTNRTSDYWVKWDNVYKNMEQHEVNLNTLNYLIGKDNIEDEARNLFTKQPQLLESMPILLGCRELNLDVLNLKDMSTYNLNFKQPNIAELDKYIVFLREAGLFDFLQNKANRSLVDYVYGVQVGLDSNGRKNRGGTLNEKILARSLIDLKKQVPYLETDLQATRQKILSRWYIEVPEGLEKDRAGGRRYDGAIYNPKKDTVTIIETNFYGSRGSKLKSVCGEFAEMYQTYLRHVVNVDFVWITDGPGWTTARNPLAEAIKVIPNVFNLNMVKAGYLRETVI